MSSDSQPYWGVLGRFWKFFWSEYMVPAVIDGCHSWKHNHYLLAWGDPQGKWKVLFRLPF